MIGTHSVTVGATDISCWIDSVDINHGRNDPTGQPEASAATIDITTSHAEPLPLAVDIGATVTVKTTTPGGAFTRFTGRITDINLGWDDAGEATPDSGIGQIVAVGLLADIARRNVGDTPFPQELDGARVSRVATLAGITLSPATSDPGTVQITPRDIDSKAALEVMHDAAESAGGMVWQTRAGDIRYADADHRRNTPSALLLDACDILVTPTWTRNLAGMVNEVSIGYGVAPEGGSDQPRYYATAAASVTKWGRYAISVATELAALADATAMGNLLLARNSAPVWNLSALPVDLKSLTDAETDALLGLDVHSLITLTGMPAISTVPTSFPAWVEGWREHLAWGVHEIEIAVSDYCRTAPPARWNDLLTTVTWDSITDGRTWDQAVCFGPIVSQGRWDDVAATTRWDDVAATVTWDNYAYA